MVLIIVQVSQHDLFDFTFVTFGAKASDDRSLLIFAELEQRREREGCVPVGFIAVVGKQVAHYDVLIDRGLQ